MATLNGMFDVNNVVEEDSFELLPPGDYPAMIIQSEERQTKSGNGSYHTLTLEVIDGPFKGRRLWHNLNLNNPNPKAVSIAQQHLAQACRATGVQQITDTEQLHYKPLIAVVKVVPPKDQWEAKNEVKGYKAMNPAAAQAFTNANEVPAASFAPNHNPAAGNQQQLPPGAPSAPPAAAMAPTPAAAPSVSAPPPGAAPGGNAPPWTK